MNKPKFTIRGLAVVILIVGMGLGWRSSVQGLKRLRNRQQARLEYAEAELERARDELTNAREPRKGRILSAANLSGMGLKGVTISSTNNAFQNALLVESDLSDATLAAGPAAFQLASFDRAKLTGATLSGGGSSFQLATFVDADLTGATLRGQGASFQSASFERALLVNATMVGDFQGCNLSEADLSGADLTGIADYALGSCYFKIAPTYDDQTKFPTAFDPVAKQWKKR